MTNNWLVNKLRAQEFESLTHEEKLFILSIPKGVFDNIAGVTDFSHMPDDADLKEIAYNDKVVLIDTPRFVVGRKLYQISPRKSFNEISGVVDFINEYDGKTYIYSIDKGIGFEYDNPYNRYFLRYLRLTDEFFKSIEPNPIVLSQSFGDSTAEENI